MLLNRRAILWVTLFIPGLAACTNQGAQMPLPNGAFHSNVGAIPYKLEPSELILWEDPIVDIHSGNVLIAGQIKLKKGKLNPDAVVHIAVVDPHSNLESEMDAVLIEGATEGTLSYRIRFAPVPSHGRVVLISYQDYYTSGFSGGSGGSGSSGASGPGLVRTGQTSRAGRGNEIKSAGGGGKSK